MGVAKIGTSDIAEFCTYYTSAVQQKLSLRYLLRINCEAEIPLHVGYRAAGQALQGRGFLTICHDKIHNQWLSLGKAECPVDFWQDCAKCLSNCYFNAVQYQQHSVSRSLVQYRHGNLIILGFHNLSFQKWPRESPSSERLLSIWQSSKRDCMCYHLATHWHYEHRHQTIFLAAAKYTLSRVVLRHAKD